VFYLDIATGRGPARLVLRCDADGNVWTSVAPAGDASDRALSDEPAE